MVEKIRRILPAVVVVDDGSVDRTATEARTAGAEVICHRETRGKGAALGSGWNLARNRGFKWALTMDGDGQHDPEDIPKFLGCAGDGTVDLVIGNRMADPGSMPWLRRVVNRWMSRRISKNAGVWLPDSQCGFRLVRMAAMDKISLETTHFEIESEQLWGFIRNGLSLKFVPIKTIYKDEQSKIHPLRDTCRWFQWWRNVRRRQRSQNPS